MRTRGEGRSAAAVRNVAKRNSRGLCGMDVCMSNPSDSTLNFIPSSVPGSTWLGKESDPPLLFEKAFDKTGLKTDGST